jgi:phosphoenolpyruvate-protein phosphotransferase
MQQYIGIPASGGIAIGPAWIYRPQQVRVDRYTVQDASLEWTKLQTAISMARTQLQALEARAQEMVGAEEAAIFGAHLMFLDDEELLASLSDLVQGQRLNAKAAVQDAFGHYADALLSLEEEYFKARAQDVSDVGQRVLRCLEGNGNQASTKLVKQVIILAEDLTPSDTIQFDRENILGIATIKGGPTSHTAILARALGVPAVVSIPLPLDDILAETLLILDGVQGEVTIGPTLKELDLARKRQDEWHSRVEIELSRATQPATTKDGHSAEIVANIGNADDARMAIRQGAEGVGLFRTEFLYLDRDSLPRLSEQVDAYQDVFSIMQGKPVVVRTLDIGGDKAVSYLGFSAEPNPFLGWRAIRMIRERPDVLENQFRALLLAAGKTNADLRIMLPMVSTIGEVERARELFDKCSESIQQSDHPLPEKIQFGIMVEVPSTAILADKFSKVVDFFSIGTNDLTQYTLAVDRTNERVAQLASPYHPAVLRLIQYTIQAAHAEGKWVGLCGELAGDPQAVPFLLGVHLDEFSMAPSSIPTVKEAIRAWSLSTCEQIAYTALQLPKAADVIEYLKSLKAS